MMTQPQGTSAPLSGMAVPVNVPGSPRQPAIAVQFANLLEDMLPPAENSAESTAVATPVGTGLASPVTAAVSGKEKAGADSLDGARSGKETAGEQQPDAIESQLAQFVAMAGQVPTELPQTPAGVSPEGRSAGLTGTGGINADGSPGKAPGTPAPRSAIVAGEGVGSTLGQTWQAGYVHTVQAGVPAAGRSDEAGQTPVAAGIQGHGAGQTRQAIGQTPSRADGKAPGQPEELTQPVATPDTQERTTSQPLNGNPSSSGDKAQGHPSGPVPFTPIFPNAVPTRLEGAADMSAPFAGLTMSMKSFPAYNKPVSTEEPVSAAAPLQRPGAADGNPATLLADAVVADASSKDTPFEGNGKGESAAKEKEKGGELGSAVAMTRTPDAPATTRFALQAKVEEPRSALHESILSQVKESVVNHDGKGNGMISVKLNPVELGDLQVNLRIENHQVKVEIITENRTVREALMGNLDSLKDTFLKQNLTMERFEVVSGGGNGFSNGFSQGFRDERGDQRRIATLPPGHESAPFETARERGMDDWGVADNSLVNLRL